MTTDTPPSNRVEEIFAKAAAMPQDNRAAWLDKVCAEEPDLRRAVDGLLLSHEATAFMDISLQNTAIQAEFARLRPEEAGDCIANYKLLEQIGEGGFGVVWMAEQEKPIRRHVAIKIIKLGMDTKEVIARFEQERQALALMDSQNIARVIDAGTTASGRPFFVMELVRGIRITDYCDQSNLSIKERLELFTQVCHAVQHAHQKGIIHRDLKPSNILVTQHEGEPIPKVIDFGVAKATQGRLGDLSVYTRFEQMIGTPLYMSPEQADMNGLDIDTRADIYALGVLLYALLIGRTPLDAETAMKRGYDEMRRIIREHDPQRPTTALHTMAGERLAEVARQRASEPSKLIHAIHGDLDWIVMKALEKDRSRRYETASSLAADIHRHLAHETVTATPPSRIYQFRKFVRRNKLAVTSSLAVVGALSAGIVVSLLQMARARHAEHEQSQLRAAAESAQKRSEAEAKRSAAVSSFLQELLFSADPAASKGTTYTVRQLLDESSSRLKDQFIDDPETEATLRYIIGTAYRGLGATKIAKAQHERALELRRNTFGEESTQVAESLTQYLWVFMDEGKAGEAERNARRAVDIFKKHGVSDERLLTAYLALVHSLIYQRRTTEIDDIGREFMSAAARSHLTESAKAASLAHMYSDLRGQQGRYPEAERYARTAVALHSRFSKPDSIQVGWAQFFLGSALKGQQKWAEAEMAYRKSLQIFSKAFAPDHEFVVGTTKDLNRAIAEAKKQADEIKIIESGEAQRVAKNLARIAREFPQDPDWRKKLVEHYQNFGKQLAGVGRHEDAELSFREALNASERATRDFPNETSFREESAAALRNSGSALCSLERFDEAEKNYRESIAIYATLAAEFPRRFNNFMKADHATQDLSKALDKAQRPSRRDYTPAIAPSEKALSILRGIPGTELDVAALQFGLSHLYRQAGDLTKAEAASLAGC